MSPEPKSFRGLEINDRLRVVDLIEERPFSLLFKGEVLALDRVVGVCTVTIYRPADKIDPDDIVNRIGGHFSFRKENSRRSSSGQHTQTCKIPSA